MPKQTFFNLTEEKREHILDVAIREFAERGYSAASISHMVAEAHIAKGSFYQYFEDKDDLYIYIIHTKIAQRKMAGFAREKEKLADMTFTQFLRTVFRGLIDDLSQSPDIIKISTELSRMRGSEIYTKIFERYQGSTDAFYMDFITSEKQRGKIDGRVNAKLLNYMLVSVGQYISYLVADEKAQVTPELVESIVDDMEFILANGIYGTEKGG
ncbi:MAG: TetR/AcrR family transcriptional regulator [Oscillospiraceae bacterium]|nr:TetR/AcrR family transcriptional regulator [Oscillospiraceae bacterium]